jgi:zinc and cadmium transporter
MTVLSYSIISTLVVSAVSLVGVVMLALNKDILNKIVFYLVAISAGSMMGGAFIHLIPEAIESVAGEHQKEQIFVFILAGFALFFILERVLHWHHCHKHNEKCEAHPFTYLNLVGDGLHNFIDGIVVAAAFSVNFELGIATTIVVITHEIPQEISDFGVLIHGGFTKAKALLCNFLSGTLAILGAVFGVMLSQYAQWATPMLLALTAGGFIYISASDLIPELHKESKLYKSIIAFVCFFIGVGLMIFLKEGHAN